LMRKYAVASTSVMRMRTHLMKERIDAILKGLAPHKYKGCDSTEMKNSIMTHIASIDYLKILRHLYKHKLKEDHELNLNLVRQTIKNECTKLVNNITSDMSLDQSYTVLEQGIGKTAEEICHKLNINTDTVYYIIYMFMGNLYE